MVAPRGFVVTAPPPSLDALGRESLAACCLHSRPSGHGIIPR